MNLDRIAQDAVKRRRRQMLIVLLEAALGDLVALDGVEDTKKVIAKFQQQLEL